MKTTKNRHSPPKAFTTEQSFMFNQKLCQLAKEKYMYFMVMFDLPTKSPSERKAASRFRKSLIDDGFLMLQFSVYARFIKSGEYRDKHAKRLKKMLPNKGMVNSLLITSGQFKAMSLDVGIAKPTQKKALEQQELFEL